jgi:hypothetical protein
MDKLSNIKIGAKLALAFGADISLVACLMGVALMAAKVAHLASRGNEGRQLKQSLRPRALARISSALANAIEHWCVSV